MVTSEALSNGILPGSADLIGSLGVAALGSEDLTGVLNAIRSTGTYTPRANLTSDVAGLSLDQSSDVDSRRIGRNTSDSFSQPTTPIVTTNNSRRASTADVDPLIGTSASEPLVSAAVAPGRIRVLTSVPDQYIIPNRVVFSTVAGEVRAPKPVLLTNTGTGPLTVTVNINNSKQGLAKRLADNNRAFDFKLTGAAAGTPFVIQAGKSRVINVQFVPLRNASNSTDSITDTFNGENYASLIIKSNDPTRPTSVVQLAGLNAAAYEGVNEPSIAEIARVFGFKTNIGSEKQFVGGAKTPLGDEVYSPYWLQANKSTPVRLWALANISSREANPTGKTSFRYRVPGGELLYSFAGRRNDDNEPGSNRQSGGENQKLLPKIFLDNLNITQTPAGVSFTPIRAFSLIANGASTDDTRNGLGQLRNWRIYAVRNAEGELVRNTWFATQDNGNSVTQSKNYDYQDKVFLLTNARPESAAADFSGDAESDLLWRNQATGTNALWRLNNTTFVSSAFLRTVKDSNWVIGGTGDANGDGKTDIFWRNQATGVNAIWLMNRGTFLSSVFLPTVKDSNWQIGGTEDFDRDGNLDVLWRNIATGKNAVWRLNRTTFVSSVSLTAPSVKGGWRIAGTADFSGDGRPDILWRNIITGQDVIWRMGGPSGTTYVSSATLAQVKPSTGWRIGGTADYDSDGDPDIAWHNRLTGRSSIWRMNGTAFSSSVFLSPVVKDSNWFIEGPR